MTTARRKRMGLAEAEAAEAEATERQIENALTEINECLRSQSQFDRDALIRLVNKARLARASEERIETALKASGLSEEQADDVVRGEGYTGSPW